MPKTSRPSSIDEIKADLKKPKRRKRPKRRINTELKVRPVKLDNRHDALGRNIIGVVSISDYADVQLVDEIQRRIRGIVGRLD